MVREQAPVARRPLDKEEPRQIDDRGNDHGDQADRERLRDRSPLLSWSDEPDEHCDRDDEPGHPAVVLYELREPHKEAKADRSPGTRPFEESDPGDHHQRPAKQEGRVGQAHSREDQMRPGQGDDRGRGCPCPPAEAGSGKPGKNRDRCDPCQHRDEDCHHSGKPDHPVEQTNEHRKARRGVRNQPGIDREDSPVRKRPRGSLRVDSLVEMVEPERSQILQTHSRSKHRHGDDPDGLPPDSSRHRFKVGVHERHSTRQVDRSRSPGST